ncbi:phage holin family protein [Bacillus sp. HMF5848]|uniref:phage holin family protein n=1 Tax=Bacillus sp. HMF5848 TaxID=2495421 RepID=UPI000F7A6F49|nr:phage holin family protein [Bacillus sp. HMF5848]RSK28574.1 phage holin family protein [Bacillus sp. HMF5848]
MKWVVRLLVNGVILLIVASVLDNFHLDGFITAVIAAILLSVLNAIVKPILVVLTLPVTILSLGLFLFVINAATLMIAQAVIGDSFVINGFGTAIIASIIISLLNLVVQPFVDKKKK